MKCIFSKSSTKLCRLRLSAFVADHFQTLSVSSLLLISLLGIVSDPQEGILIESFDYRTPNGLHFTVLSDSQESTNDLYEWFRKASLTKAPKFKSKQSAIT
jgi:hypothetical protein